jgi:hypothetical protein
MVAPRELLAGLGGWHDLQFRENWELCRRAARMDQYRWTIFPLVASVNPHPERITLRSVIRYRYIRYRENLRVGHRQFDETEKTGIGQKVVWFAARLSVMFTEKYQVDYPFTAVDPRYFVDSRGYWAEDTDLEKERNLYRIGLKRELGNEFSI